MNFETTVDKFQGWTIDGRFNIHEVEKMSFEALYTALTRAKRLSDIHLDMTKLRKLYKSEYGRPGFK